MIKRINIILVLMFLSINCNAYIVSNFGTPENETINFILSYVSEGQKVPTEPTINAFNVHYAIIFSSSLTGSEFTILACNFKNSDNMYNYDAVYILNSSNITTSQTFVFNFTIPMDRKIYCLARDDSHNKAVHAIATPSDKITFSGDNYIWLQSIQRSNGWRYLIYQFVNITSQIMDAIFSIIHIIVLIMTYLGTSFVLALSIIYPINILRSQLKKAKKKGGK